MRPDPTAPDRAGPPTARGTGVSTGQAAVQRTDPTVPTASNTEQRDPIGAAAELLAHRGVPGIGEKLLTEHADDTTGHCRACYSSSGAFPVWPCNLWLIGSEVQRMVTEDGAVNSPRQAAPSTFKLAATPGGLRAGRGHHKPTRLRGP